MGTYNFKAPVSSLTSPYDYVKDANSKTAWEKWAPQIKNASKLANIPVNVIYSFMMVESKGKKEFADKNQITPGLMQWNNTYAYETIEKEKNKGRLSAAEEEFLAKKGIKFKKVGNAWQITGTPVTQQGKYRVIAKSTAIDPELNIYIGAMYLGQYMDEKWGTDADGTVRMDRIITKYNWGLQGFTNNNIASKTLEQILAVVPKTTSDYIKQSIGTNGTLHASTNLNIPKTVHS